MGAIVYSGQPATSDAALFTATSNTPITHIIASNATGGAATLTLSIHRIGSGNVEVLATALSVGASAALSLVSDRLLADEEYILYNGDSLHGLASAGTTISVLAFS
jgi:hypothetical protein